MQAYRFKEFKFPCLSILFYSGNHYENYMIIAFHTFLNICSSAVLCYKAPYFFQIIHFFNLTLKYNNHIPKSFALLLQ